MWYVSASWLHETAVVHKRGTSVESWPGIGGRAASTSLIQSLSRHAIGSLERFSSFLLTLSFHNLKLFIIHFMCYKCIKIKINHLSSHKTACYDGTHASRVIGESALIHPCQNPNLGDFSLPQDHVYRFLEGRFAKKRKYLPGFFHRLSRSTH